MIKNKLKRYQIVDIFIDVISQQCFEGSAKLVKYLGNVGFLNNFPIERWQVKFRDEKNNFSKEVRERNIYVNDK